MTLFQRLLVLALAVTALRIVVLAVSPTDLFFDEAQYWAWGQSLDWGYFSKPPLIGWVIRTFTEIAGSDAPFWVRLAAPVFHGATSIILGLFIASIYRPAAIWTAAVYLSMPIITIGSWMISTDTIMAPFLAAAIWMWWRYLHTFSLRIALLAGVFAGTAAMAKYAGSYFFLIVFLTAIFAPPRPRVSGILTALIGFFVILAQNLLWNVQNGMVTFSHTADNASWGGLSTLNWTGLLEFALAQAFVIGPVFFVVWLATLPKAVDRAERYLLAASLPIVLLICGQAVISQAYANWAFAAYLTAAPLVALRLCRGKAWKTLYAGLAVNVALSVIVSLLIMWPSLVRNASDRYMGRTDLANTILETAQAPVVATDRQLLADLTYAAQRNGGLNKVFAYNPSDVWHHWYDMVAPLPANTDAVFVAETNVPPACNGSTIQPFSEIPVEEGAYSGRTYGLYHFSLNCTE
ncbi:ArnT family glycosyltransferase [Falsihalocynthiibacter sp. SS001]|uniref:ArnT family glycosyltransferase n=1 Tax=Falsihalocynthiibacter sp. SS001 TaxID=3349698 RepID=UPI0036D25B47